MKIDEILATPINELFQQSPDARQKNLLIAIHESLIHQFSNCDLYHYICRKRNFNPNNDLRKIDQIANIPYITTSSFKRFGNKAKDLTLYPEDKIILWSLSQGTTFDQSMIGRSMINLERLMRSFEQSLHSITKIYQYSWVLNFFVPEIKYPIQELNKARKSGKEEYSKPFKLQFAPYFLTQGFQGDDTEWIDCIEIKDPNARNPLKKYGVNIAVLQEFLQKKKFLSPGIIIGNPTTLLQTFSSLKGMMPLPIPFEPSSMIFTFGDWKIGRQPKIEPEDFRVQLMQITNIPSQNIRDIYGFTETDAFFVECEYHNKHVLPYIKVIIRDVETLEPIPDGQSGIVNIINPLIDSYAGLSIIQDDIGVLHQDFKCSCGIQSDIIEILGKAV